MKVNSTDTSPLNIKLPFPPQITSSNLIEKAVTKLRTSGKTSRIPNGFLCYRMAFCKELQALKHPVITQPQLSALAKQSWLKEPEHVRTEYQKIAAEAKNIYKQSCIEQKLILHEQKNKLKNVQESSPATANFNYSTSTASSSSSSPETKNLNNLHFSLQKFTENGPFTNTELYPNFHTSGTTPFSYNYPNFFCHQLLTPEVQPRKLDNTQTNLGSLQFECISPQTLLTQNSITNFSSSENSCEECNGKIDALTQRVEDLEKKLTELTKQLNQIQQTAYSPISDLTE